MFIPHNHKTSHHNHETSYVINGWPLSPAWNIYKLFISPTFLIRCVVLHNLEINQAKVDLHTRFYFYFSKYVIFLSKSCWMSLEWQKSWQCFAVIIRSVNWFWNDEILCQIIVLKMVSSIWMVCNLFNYTYKMMLSLLLH